MGPINYIQKTHWSFLKYVLLEFLLGKVRIYICTVNIKNLLDMSPGGGGSILSYTD